MASLANFSNEFEANDTETLQYSSDIFFVAVSMYFSSNEDFFFLEDEFLSLFHHSTVFPK